MTTFSRVGILASAALMAGLCLYAPKAEADVIFISNEAASIDGQMGGTGQNIWGMAD